MKMIFSILTSLAVSLMVSCRQDGPKPVPHWVDPVDTIRLSSQLYEPEKARTGIAFPSDMVLVYGGGHHRTPFAWDRERIATYVTYTDKDGSAHWLFDGFLLLEFMDPAANGGPGKTLVTGYKYNGAYMPSANKEDWQHLVDYYFSPGSGVDAIDAAVAGAEAKSGAPKERRKIVIGIPEPIVDLYSATHSGGKTYWGSLDGRKLDFSSDRDRILACKWYIDEVRRQFYSKKYRNVELAGFYWVAETSAHTESILGALGKYLNQLKYSFNWIPYFKATGYSRWKEFGFNIAYLQPNYFFNASVPKSRLEEACDLAMQFGMDMELEFDDNAMTRHGRAYKLRDYMEVFKAKGVWASRRLAYYQGGWTLFNLQHSADEQDQALYHAFCNFVTARPLRH